MTQPISSTNVTSFATELAALLIQNETMQSDADRTTRDTARATFLQDSQNQVDALHAAADATEQGALVGAAFSVAAGACSIGAASYKFDAETDGCDKIAAASDSESASDLGTLGSTYSALGKLEETCVGQAQSEHDHASAKRFETLAAQAKWQADDAATEVNKTATLGGKILDIVQSLNQDQSSATNAVIGRI
ncbi:MAG TPA: hypothetical protein VK745_21435 [Polyangiaceae bacterium]|nr:hypothetical protein [Polyangiaceae bacterium]